MRKTLQIASVEPQSALQPSAVATASATTFPTSVVGSADTAAEAVVVEDGATTGH
ncbi:unnamed protein product, partial [Tilletia controversa]